MKPVIKTIARRLLLLAAVGLPLWMLSRNFSEVIAATSGANWFLVAAVLLGLVLYTVWNASVWSHVLAGLGQPVGKLAATRMWIESEALKWLPGGIWGYASRVANAPRIGVTRKTAGSSLVVELLLTITAWATIALAGQAGDSVLQAKILALIAPLRDLSPAVIVSLVVGFAIVIGTLAHPVIRVRLTKKLGLENGMRWTSLLKAFCSYVALCFLHAVLLSLLVLAVTGNSIALPAAASADGSAWLIGFFAIGVPGGIGVREAGITWFLAAHMSTPEAMAVAVLWRALQVAAELTGFGLSKLAGVRKPVRALDNSLNIA